MSLLGTRLRCNDAHFTVSAQAYSGVTTRLNGVSQRIDCHLSVFTSSGRGVALNLTSLLSQAPAELQIFDGDSVQATVLGTLTSTDAGPQALDQSLGILFRGSTTSGKPLKLDCHHRVGIVGSSAFAVLVGEDMEIEVLWLSIV